MLAETYDIWRRVVTTAGLWTVLVWTLAWGALLGITIVVLGIGSLYASVVPHTAGGFASHPALPRFGRLLVDVGIVTLLYIALAPLGIAGTYGTVARAVVGEPVSWGTFWPLALRLYGKAWALILYGLLYAAALAIISGLVLALLHVVLALVVVVVGMVLSMPFAIRVCGGLFVEEFRFGESFRQSLRGDRYGGILGAAWMGILVMTAGLGILAALAHALGPVIEGVYYLATVALVVLAPAWFLALYHVSTRDRDLRRSIDTAR